ncbi:MAG: hypothetical protein N3G21_10240 [Candidatus Hydrogenedentes bacterium]|nr:hypothetical protein [Candidatus Hydrogenedentota bacterium]
MKQVNSSLVIFLFSYLMICFYSYSIPPAYSGPLGNAEEPALRPYKWFLRGILALGHQTKEKFIEGNMNTPILGTIETGRGIRRGSTELLYSFWKGILYACPPQRTQFHKEETELTKRVEADAVWKNVGDLLCTGPAYPVLIALDHVYVESDSKVKERLQKAREIQQSRRESQSIRAQRMPLSELERAQRNYIGERAELGRKGKKYPKNLLKLAK